jgi:hypothetical protein
LATTARSARPSGIANEIEHHQGDEDRQRAPKTRGQAIDGEDQCDAGDSEGEHEWFAGIRRVGAGGDVDRNADKGDAGDDEERADDHGRKQRAHLADDGAGSKQDEATEHHGGARTGETRGFGHRHHRDDVDGMGAQHDRQPRADKAEPERRHSCPDPAAEHHAGQHVGA